jgi:hypothetical protein
VTGPTGFNTFYIFNGGTPTSVYSVGPAFDCGGVGYTGNIGPSGNYNGTNIQFQLRRGISTEWTTVNPTLADAEVGLETDTRLFKIGDGVTAWNALPYGGLNGATGPTGAGVTGPTGPAGATSNTLTLSTLTMTGPIAVQQIQESFSTIISASGVVTHDWNSGGVFYHSSIISSFTANIINLPTTANRSYVVSLILQQSTAQAFYANALQINSVATRIQWPNGTVPTLSNYSTIVQSFTMLYTGINWLPLAQITQFG